MYLSIGTPHKLSDIGKTCPELVELKQKIKIAIIDDKAFAKSGALRNHGFQITELGGNISSIEQTEAYPVVICDIKGVGKAFGSSYEGAHVLSEIRKAYPDKYLISYSGSEYNVSYNELLAKADKSITKDAPTEYWVAILEEAIATVGDPKERWLRFRKKLFEKNADAYDIFRIEQSFIKSLKEKSTSPMSETAVPDELKDIVKTFITVGLSQLIEFLGGR